MVLNMDTKENEKKYISKLTDKEKKWVETKPFGDYNLHESFLRIRDFSYIVELLSLESTKHLSVLDLGCGSGWTSIFLAKLGCSVTGVDISEEMIDIAKENAKKENNLPKGKIKFVAADIEKISFKNQFDRVLIYDGLHHCPDEKKVLKNIFKALKPGGMVLVVEPNKRHGRDKNVQEISKKFGVLEKGYSPLYLKKILTKIGFKDIARYHCDYGINRPLDNKFKSFFIYFAKLIVNRMVFSYYVSQVWIRAKK